MPGFDKKGPAGGGPLTGGGRGLCGAQTGIGRRVSQGVGFGAGRGGPPRGGGRGRCFGGAGYRGAQGNYSYQTMPADTEAEVLRTELAEARTQIATMEARLKDLEKKE
jgi:Family of unknown function (DUF5320)